MPADNWKQWVVDAVENLPLGSSLLDRVAVERILNEVVYHKDTNGLYDAKVICLKKSR